jgi:hypothetical protein
MPSARCRYELIQIDSAEGSEKQDTDIIDQCWISQPCEADMAGYRLGSIHQSQRKLRRLRCGYV